MRFPLPPFATRTKKKRRPQKTPGWQSPESAALDRIYLLFRNIVIAGAILTLIILIVAGRNVFIERRNAILSRPRIVNTRPPELLQPFVCDLKTGLHSGRLQTFVRNVENAEPGSVFQTLALHIVPAQKVGIPEFDEVPNGNCQDRPGGGSPTTLLPGGRETVTGLAEPKVMMPPLLTGETAQLYGVNCIYYSDSAGSSHTSCDTYRFRLAGGSPYFVCDGSPNAGTFDAVPVTSCGN